MTTMSATKEATQSAVHEVRGSVMNAVKNAAEILALLRRMGVDDALKVVGLMRRRSPLIVGGAFASGVVLGAGLGLLFAPQSGADFRRALLTRIRAQRGEAKDRLANAAHSVEEKVKTVMRHGHAAGHPSTNMPSGGPNMPSGGPASTEMNEAKPFFSDEPP